MKGLKQIHGCCGATFEFLSSDNSLLVSDLRESVRACTMILLLLVDKGKTQENAQVRKRRMVNRGYSFMERNKKINATKTEKKHKIT